MNSKLSSDKIKAEAYNLGFFACGIAKAAPVNSDTAALFRRWLTCNGHADMGYMANNIEKRLDPCLLMEGVKSIVCVAMSYVPSCTMPKNELQIASYALGEDYHNVIKTKLHALAARLNITDYRAYCDTAPVLERYWAEQAGLGWIGRNKQLIIPHVGSMFFLGELFIGVDTEYDKPQPSRCGQCQACTDACPTGALHGISTEREEKESGKWLLDSNLCISYHTIENRSDIPYSIVEKMGNSIYGCDRCQTACPWNRFAVPTTEELFKPKEKLLEMTRNKWECMTVDEYRALFKGSAVKRVKYDGLMRNIRLCISQEQKEKSKD